VWLTTAEFHYLLAPAGSWGDRLRALSQSGINAVVLPCAWSYHEEQAGRFDFAAGRGLRQAVELCARHGMWVILKAGPVVGGPYPGGGLPAWLSDLPGIRLRQPNQAFFERVTSWYRAIAEQVTGWLASDIAPASLRKLRPGCETGPVIGVQLEHAWHCAQEAIAESYLAELVRFAREVGLAVPILTANDSFAISDAAIDMLEARAEPLALMRQLTAVRPGFPRFARLTRHGAPDTTAADAALVLAGLGQFVLTDAVGTMGVDLLGGPSEGRVTGHDGFPIASAGPIRRIAHFASSFGHVLAQAEPSRSPVVLDPSTGPGSPTVLPVSGTGGTAVFIVGGPTSGAKSDGRGGKNGSKSAPARHGLSLLSPDGRSFPVSVGSPGLAWFLFDVDIGGKIRIDYATVTPLLHVDGSILLFVGPAGEEAEVSLDGSPMTLRVPADSAGSKPFVTKVRDTAVVLCNESQADTVTVVDGSLVIGAADVGNGERFRLFPGFKSAMRVRRDGTVQTLGKEALAESSSAISSPLPREWSPLPATEFINGTSHRFASLDGPMSLSACGGRDGFGWYRVSFRRAAAGKALIHVPQLAERATIWHNGSRIASIGRGGDALPLELKLAAGNHSLVLLVRDDDRPAGGNRAGRRAGLYGPIVEVSPIRATPKVDRNVRVDPFALGVVQELHPGDARPGIALTWKLTARKTERFIIDMPDATRATLGGATITVNGEPVARWNVDGPDGLAATFGLVVDPSSVIQSGKKSHAKAVKAAAAKVSAKEGPIEIRLVLDGDADEAELESLSASVRLFEVTGELGGSPSYAFARWGPPTVWPNGAASRSASPAKGTPAWYGTVVRGAADEERAVRIDSVQPVSAFQNGVRMPMAARVGGIAFVGQLQPGMNEIAVFDELGTAPPTIAWDG
jgi:hypothetical protein